MIAAEAPPWIGPLDVLIVAGDDPGDPALVGAAASGVRRGARVVVAAPYEGPLRDTTAGRVAVMEPRLPVAGDFGLCRYLAVGLAVLESVDPRLRVDLAALADELDAEALRNSASREVFTNPAKALVERMARRRVVVVGDCAATLALARHGSGVLLRAANEVAAATGLADALTALRLGPGPGFVDPAEALFHDEEIDGPLTDRLRILVLTLDAERAVVAARVAGFDDIDLVGADDVPDVPNGTPHQARSSTRGAAAGYIGCPVGDGGGLFAAGAGITGSEVMASAVVTWSDTNIRVGVTDRHRGIHWSSGTGCAPGSRTLAGR